MDFVYWNAAGQRFPLPEQETEPKDARMDCAPRRGDTRGKDDEWETVCSLDNERWN